MNIKAREIIKKVKHNDKMNCSPVNLNYNSMFKKYKSLLCGKDWTQVILIQYENEGDKPYKINTIGEGTNIKVNYSSKLVNY